jgi:hypothetical protein
MTLCLVLAFTLATLDLAPTQATVAPVALPVPSAERAAEGSGDGLLFIENAGQFDPAARFQVWGGGQTLWLAEDALWLTIVESGDGEQGAERFSVAPAEQSAARGSVPQKAVNLRLSFPGANQQPALEPFNRLDTHVSYFIGNDPARWRADVPVWGGVRYRELYPGLDLEITGAGGQWQWRLISNSKSEVQNPPVTLRVEGADTVAVEDIVLRIGTAAGDLTLPLLTTERPNAQRANVERANVQAFDVIAPFALAPAKAAISATAGYAVTSPQSSGLRYATFLGGSGEDGGDDSGRSIAVDGAGQAYITGGTESTNFPAGPGYDTGFNGDYDAFVVKLNAAGTGLRYATFLGGRGQDFGWGIAVDSAGQAYIAGHTCSPDFPASLGPGYDTSFNGDESQFDADAFVVKLDAAGISLPTATPTATPTSTPTPTATRTSRPRLHLPLVLR